MKITIIMVLYKQNINESKTFKTLNKAFRNHSELLDQIEFVVYDNSPESQSLSDKKKWGKVQYVHDPRNLGISTAYNYAYQTAKVNGSQWVLLLDHDTELTEDYVNQISSNLEIDLEVAAVVPRIFSGQTLISPVVANTLRPLKTDSLQAGLYSSPIMAINSGSLIRVSFLEKIKGFNNDFPLDYLDHWLFHEIFSNGYKVMVMESSLNHDLSVMNYENVSISRYRSILDSEIRYYKIYKKELLPAYRIQLLKRLAKQLLLVKNKKIAAYTFRCLFSI
ncbi:rhamnosyltransferase [Mycobacteroides abscessus subsp. abscessus]|nr:rhamnosyltransferase [Mycobacteroides abscessus subsp. abscessus]